MARFFYQYLSLPPLRGSGSQSYSQYNGSNKGYSSTTYSSGSTGEIQGDAMRWFTSYSSAAQEMAENLDWTNVTGRTAESIYTEVAPVGWANAQSDSNMSTPFGAGATYFSLEGLFRYRLVGSGEDVSLEEYWDDTVHPSTKMTIMGGGSVDGEGVNGSYADSKLALPTADEIRPVNIAVRYFIRAR